MPRKYTQTKERTKRTTPKPSEKSLKNLRNDARGVERDEILPPDFYQKPSFLRVKAAVLKAVEKGKGLSKREIKAKICGYSERTCGDFFIVAITQLEGEGLLWVDEKSNALYDLIYSGRPDPNRFVREVKFQKGQVVEVKAKRKILQPHSESIYTQI